MKKSFLFFAALFAVNIQAQVPIKGEFFGCKFGMSLDQTCSLIKDGFYDAECYNFLGVGLIIANDVYFGSTKWTTLNLKVFFGKHPNSYLSSITFVQVKENREAAYDFFLKQKASLMQKYPLVKNTASSSLSSEIIEESYGYWYQGREVLLQLFKVSETSFFEWEPKSKKEQYWKICLFYTDNNYISKVKKEIKEENSY